MRYVGTTARGIRTGIIKEGDNLEEIVVNSVLRASESENFKIRDRDIIGVTEAVVGIASGNYVTVDDIAEDIKNKFPNKEVIVIYDCTAIMNQYKAWHNSCIPIQFFYGSFYWLIIID